MAITPGDYAGYDSVDTVVAQVDSTETDFPYYLDLVSLSADFWSNVQSDGGDIRVTTNSDGTGQVPIEVVSIDTTAETGELHFKDSTDAASSKTYYVWCGTTTTDTQPAVTGTYGRNAVWSDYIGVYHMNQSSSPLIDSAGNDNLGESSFPNYGVSGALGEGVDYDGSSDNNNAINTALGTTIEPLSIQAWVNLDVIGTQSIAYMGGSGTSEHGILTVSGNFWALSQDGGGNNQAIGTTSVSTNVWYMVHGVFSSNSNREIFVNGSSEGTDSTSKSVADTDNLIVADRNGSDTQHLNGTIDEVRYIASALSSGWISTEYNMQDSNSTFWTFNGWTESGGADPDNAMFYSGGW